MVVLLQIVAKIETPWMMKDLSSELGISASGISESLHRSAIAGLIAKDKKRLKKLAILDILAHGLHYVYPQKPGARVRSVPTGHAAPSLNQEIVSNEPNVWPFGEGIVRSESIEPLHSKVPKACLKDPLFYELKSLCDALRVGRARGKNSLSRCLNREYDGKYPHQ